MKIRKVENYYYLFIILRIGIALLSVNVLSSFTQLGDYGRYVNISNFDGNLSSSTQWTTLLFGTLVRFLGENGTVIILSLYSSLLIVYLTSRHVLEKSKRYMLLFVACLPSISIWTQIPSKEFIVNICILHFISLGFQSPSVFRTIRRAFFAIAVVFFKPHWFPVAIWIMYMSKKRKMMISIVGLFGVFIACVTYWEEIGRLLNSLNELAISLPRHFSSSGSATRTHYFWEYDWQWLSTMAIGSLIAFFGPTPQEALSSPINLIAFWESSLLLGIVIYCIYWITMRNKVVLNIKHFTLIMILISIVLVVNYPFGYFNPGSAVRYRGGYLFGLIFFLVVYRQKSRRTYE